jgi:hypothetical protein
MPARPSDRSRVKIKNVYRKVKMVTEWLEIRSRRPILAESLVEHLDRTAQ